MPSVRALLFSTKAAASVAHCLRSSRAWKILLKLALGCRHRHVVDKHGQQEADPLRFTALSVSLSLLSLQAAASDIRIWMLGRAGNRALVASNLRHIFGSDSSNCSALKAQQGRQAAPPRIKASGS